MKKAVTFLFLLVLALGPTLALLAQQGGGSSPNGGSLSVHYELPLPHSGKNMVAVQGEYSLISVQNDGPDPVHVCFQREGEKKMCEWVEKGQPFAASDLPGHPITMVSLEVNSGTNSSGSVGFAK